MEKRVDCSQYALFISGYSRLALLIVVVVNERFNFIRSLSTPNLSQ